MDIFGGILGGNSRNNIPKSLDGLHHDRTHCNDRLQDWAEEQGIPRECVGFYHALVGEKRKRDLEDLLKVGIVRILFARGTRNGEYPRY